jgi:hypothetical protein
MQQIEYEKINELGDKELLKESFFYPKGTASVFEKMDYNAKTISKRISPAKITKDDRRFLDKNATEKETKEFVCFGLDDYNGKLSKRYDALKHAGYGVHALIEKLKSEGF